MLNQTKQAIEALKNAGFKRSEFSVRAERNVFTYNGQRHVEYGLAQIYIKAKLERQLELLNNMLNEGLSVTLFTRNGDVRHLSVEDDGNGKLEKIEMY